MLNVISIFWMLLGSPDEVAEESFSPVTNKMYKFIIGVIKLKLLSELPMYGNLAYVIQGYHYGYVQHKVIALGCVFNIFKTESTKDIQVLLHCAHESRNYYTYTENRTFHWSIVLYCSHTHTCLLYTSRCV